MKTKLTYLVVFTFCLNYCLAQIGINTDNPQGLFHIDGAKNNPATGVPNATQLLDDFVVDKDGNAAIGKMPSSSHKFDIKGQLHVAGTGLVNAMRMVSDANGNGSWKTIDNLMKPINSVSQGTVYQASPPNTNTTLSTAWKQVSSTNITLTVGTWMVYATAGYRSVDLANACGSCMGWLRLQNLTDNVPIEIVGSLHEFSGGYWSKPSFVSVVTVTKNTVIALWAADDYQSNINPNYGGAHFAAIKLLD